MANADTGTVTSLSDLVAEEIRVLLTRRRMSQRQLAQAMGVSHAWLNYRLTGVKTIDLDDLQRIADVLGVQVSALLAPALRPNERSG
ncbi:helix-turn-helix domain-containing protein [Micromonospora craterilacus]|nr:helix-turn-helix transcriptional regulator [Micromonospora craterilacus]